MIEPDHDGDRVLAAFRELTEQVPRPSPRIGRRGFPAVAFAAAVIGVLLIGMVGLALVISVPRGTIGPGAEDTPGSSTGRAVTWAVDFAAPISIETTELQVLATHASCESTDAPVTYQPPHVAYEEDAVTITIFEAGTFDPTECRFSPASSLVPLIVRLREPIGERVLRDGSVPHKAATWHRPQSDLVALPTFQPYRPPVGVPFVSACAGVGLEGVTLTGDPSDPRVAWLVRDDAGAASGDLIWPPGYRSQVRS